LVERTDITVSSEWLQTVEKLANKFNRPLPDMAETCLKIGILVLDVPELRSSLQKEIERRHIL